MTLYDGQPLTEDEVAANALCECRHPFKSHRETFCRLCGRCKKFVEDVRLYGEREQED